MRYTLMTADLRYKTILVTDKKTAMGEAECLQFGTGTHLQEAIAVAKAVQEYACIRFNHVNNPDWCRGLSERKNKTLVDSHHIASKDPRNIRRFKDLCSPQQINKPPKNTRDEIKKHLWTSEGLDSPVKMFKYVRVKHPDLIGIDFGVPEQNLCDEEKGTPLYHPFW